MKKDKNMQFVNSELFDLFDEQFSFRSFNNSVNKQIIKSNNVINTIGKIAMRDDKKEDDFRLVVDMSDEMKETYKNGNLKLDIVDGKTYAQLKNNGKYGKKLSISEETIKEGITDEDIAFATQLASIQEQLTQMMDALKDIEGYVVDTLQGLHNDRIGLFFSGLSTYVEASQMKDSTLKDMLISQSIKAINDSQSQVIQEFKHDLSYLINHEFEKEKGRHKRIEEKMSNIHICFESIYRATMLKSIIYFDMKQLAPMFACLEEYGRFINNFVKPYAGKLIEFDPREDRLINTIWQKRAESFKCCESLKTQLTNKHTYLLISGG